MLNIYIIYARSAPAAHAQLAVAKGMARRAPPATATAYGRPGRLRPGRAGGRPLCGQRPHPQQAERCDALAIRVDLRLADGHLASDLAAIGCIRRQLLTPRNQPTRRRGSGSGGCPLLWIEALAAIRGFYRELQTKYREIAALNPSNRRFAHERRWQATQCPAAASFSAGFCELQSGNCRIGQRV